MSHRTLVVLLIVLLILLFLPGLGLHSLGYFPSGGLALLLVILVLLAVLGII